MKIQIYPRNDIFYAVEPFYSVSNMADEQTEGLFVEPTEQTLEPAVEKQDRLSHYVARRQRKRRKLHRQEAISQRLNEILDLQNYLERKSKKEEHTIIPDPKPPVKEEFGLGSFRPTLYDAVAGKYCSIYFFQSLLTKFTGRVSVKGSIQRHLSRPLAWPLAPEEVLFRPKSAPIRYEEDDLYFQDEKLAPHQRLPESDLLKALHAYVSDYYFCTGAGDLASDGGVANLRSMDETALLAMGILMEEAARQRLGETGDLALVEADDEDEIKDPMVWTGREWARNAIDVRRRPDSQRYRKGRRSNKGADEGQSERARAEEAEDEENDEEENENAADEDEDVGDENKDVEDKDGDVEDEDVEDEDEEDEGKDLEVKNGGDEDG